MGASLGGAYNSAQSKATSTSNQNEQNTYGAPQSYLQSQLGSSLTQDLTARNTGTLTPGTAAMETQAADQINKTSGGLTDRVNAFLAARGFGKSGETGKATLQGELGRENSLANNAATFAGQQQTLNQSNLLAALNYAFTQLGQTTAASGMTTGSGSGWGVAGGVSAGATGGK
jgi:hypothetical protein